MYTATYEQQLSAISEAMTTIAKHWNSHERRDLRLGAVRFLILRYLDGIHGSTPAQQVQQTILRSLYEMMFLKQDYEDHTQVRARCWLIVEMAQDAQQLYRKEQDEQQRSAVRAAAMRDSDPADQPAADVWTAAMNEVGDFDGEEGHTPDDDLPDTLDDIEF